MKLPDNENLTAVKEKILPVLKKYRAVLAETRSRCRPQVRTQRFHSHST